MVRLNHRRRSCYGKAEKSSSIYTRNVLMGGHGFGDFLVIRGFKDEVPTDEHWHLPMDMGRDTIGSDSFRKRETDCRVPFECAQEGVDS